ncbi:hypothetical protein V1224_11580 [Lachnospiraceae bacterium JLR.KK008]
MKNSFWKVSLTVSALLAGVGLLCVIVGGLFGGVPAASQALREIEEITWIEFCGGNEYE